MTRLDLEPTCRCAAGLRRWLGAALGLVLCASPGAAQEQVDERELAARGFFQDFDELSLEALLDATEVQVGLASGREESIDRAPGSISILTRDELLNLGVRTLEEALQLLPGVDVQRDGLGRARIRLRGIGAGGPATSSPEVLLLFNGVRLDDPITGGATSLNLGVPVEDLERLELLRGPASALYGSGAVAGVISVTTRLGEAANVIEVAASGGSFGTQRHFVRVGNVSGELRLSGFVFFLDSDGAQLAIPRDTQTQRDAALGLAPVSLAPGFADTQRRAVETSYRIAFRKLELNFRYRRELAGNFVGFNDALGDRGDFDNRQWLVDVSWKRALAGGELLLRGGTQQARRFELQSAAPPDFTLPGEAEIRFPSGVLYQARLESRRSGAEARYQRELGAEHQLLAGALLQRESSVNLETLGNFDFRTQSPLPEFQALSGVASEQGRTLAALWAQDSWRRDEWTLTGGLRLDHYGDSGTALSPRLGLVWELPSGTFLKALYGRSFRAPTLAELDYDLPGFFGNPELEPTRYDSLELAAWRRMGNLRVSGSAFLGFLRDPIEAAGEAHPLDPKPLVNGAGLDTRGVEIDVLREFGVADSFFANYTFQLAEMADSGARAVAVPRHLLGLGATLELGHYLVLTPSLSVRSALPREPGDARPQLDAVALFNLHLRVRRLYRSLELAASVRNLFDQKWFDPSPLVGLPDDYPRPGFSVRVHASYSF